jgi:hypothetical protein
VIGDDFPAALPCCFALSFSVEMLGGKQLRVVCYGLCKVMINLTIAFAKTYDPPQRCHLKKLDVFAGMASRTKHGLIV